MVLTIKPQGGTMIYIGNAFSLQMVAESNYFLRVEEVDSLPNEAVSVIGHADTASVLGLPFNRVNLKMKLGDVLYVAQLQGGRLPEGCTELPEGFTFRYYKISLFPDTLGEVSYMPW